MSAFENWRREVNIILNDTIGISLGDMNGHIEENVKKLYEDGEEPIDAAQYAACEMYPTLDIEQMLFDKAMPKSKPAQKKRLKKFKVEDEN